MGELVSLESLNTEVQPKTNLEEDCVDFVAATTAALGVPSPNLSKTRSFDDSPHCASDQIPRKGDLEEEAELLRVLKLSEVDSKVSVSDPVVGHIKGEPISISVDENIAVDSGDKLEKSTGAGNNFHELEPSISDDCSASGKDSNEQTSSASALGEAANLSLKTDAINDLHQSASMGPEISIAQNDVIEKNSLDALVQNENAAIVSPEKNSGGDAKVRDQSTLTTMDHEVADESQGHDATGLSYLSTSHTNSDSSSVRFHQTDASGVLPSSVDGSEPIYEGEERVLDTRTGNFEDREPVYEGEVVLAEQADKSTLPAPDLRAKDEITPQQGRWSECHFYIILYYYL